ncbi:MAG TPA: V-type ATP synthase subunit E [Syntrophales bacterium]|nr:V-type ATP synthase subunit E [Syntrophales bacterium]HPQ45602.1 V-type ATP synthase subunit E [Syntrophales bacterium]
METDKIRAAILEKAHNEAEEIVANAKAKAKILIEQAQEQKKKRFEEEKKRIISEAQREASRILAQSSLKARQVILKEQDAIINEVIAKTRESLARETTNEQAFNTLIREAIEAFESKEKLRILVSPRDITIVRKVVNENDNLKEQTGEIVERDITGGIIAESMNGMVSIDNSFEVRLEMLRPKIMPELGSTLFGKNKQ